MYYVYRSGENYNLVMVNSLIVKTTIGPSLATQHQRLLLTCSKYLTRNSTILSDRVASSSLSLWDSVAKLKAVSFLSNRSCWSQIMEYSSPSRSDPKDNGLAWKENDSMIVSHMKGLPAISSGCGLSPFCGKTTTSTRWCSSGMSTASNSRTSPFVICGFFVMTTFPEI